MDVFGTVITSGTLILQFLGACADFDDAARRLQAEFDWDLRALEAVQTYFQQRASQSANNELAPKDAALLDRTATYLEDLVSKVQRSLGKIERKGFVGKVVNRGLWIARQADLKEMQQEVHNWTTRFHVRVLGLPEELRTVIPVANESEAPAVIKANDKLRNFVQTATSIKQARAKEMWLENSDKVTSEIVSWGSASFLPLPLDGEQLILSSREIPPDVMDGTKIFEDLKSDLGMLAAALNCLDPAVDLRLLKVEYYLYHAKSRQFLFVHKAPRPTIAMLKLQDAVDCDCFPNTKSPLNERLKIAVQLAEAILFLHSAGFVHKNVTSPSVTMLEWSDSPSQNVASGPNLQNAYLMGFDLIRDIEARTYQEGAIEETHSDPNWVWNFGIYQHPDRLVGAKSLRYTKTHDIYSLGVLLLEIGLWQPLKAALQRLDKGKSTSWADDLLKIVPKLASRVGRRYQEVVAWCLALDGKSIVKEDDFVNHVLKPLEEIVNSIS
ncbi:uncharacterized protein FOBCDRAFT_233090 [Fusarium oxysporum Fo47]|nr:uncharacterized protein FOBCDRAFT_233090 [Fusarium oxysporum Fo47]QKD61236.2 hypothetical protein FOBCDRAFT_233090 [Fusarium oxysporum Fo47]